MKIFYLQKTLFNQIQVRFCRFLFVLHQQIFDQVHIFDFIKSLFNVYSEHLVQPEVQLKSLQFLTHFTLSYFFFSNLVDFHDICSIFDRKDYQKLLLLKFCLRSYANSFQPIVYLIDFKVLSLTPLFSNFYYLIMRINLLSGI